MLYALWVQAAYAVLEAERDDLLATLADRDSSAAGLGWEREELREQVCVSCIGMDLGLRLESLNDGSCNTRPIGGGDCS